ncbi:hypothetical protein FKM82_027105 [Ascaphus truei]
MDVSFFILPGSYQQRLSGGCFVLRRSQPHTFTKDLFAHLIWENILPPNILPYFCIEETVSRLYFKRIVLFYYCQDILFFFKLLFRVCFM